MDDQGCSVSINAELGGQLQARRFGVVRDVSQFVVVVRSESTFAKRPNSSRVHYALPLSTESYARCSFNGTAPVLAHQPQCPGEPPPRPSVERQRQHSAQQSLLSKTASALLSIDTSTLCALVWHRAVLMIGYTPGRAGPSRRPPYSVVTSACTTSLGRAIPTSASTARVRSALGGETALPWRPTPVQNSNDRRTAGAEESGRTLSDRGVSPALMVWPWCVERKAG